MKRVLVTGGAGFIGSHVVEHLLKQDGIEVYIVDDFSSGSMNNLKHLDHQNLKIICGNIADYALNECVKDIAPYAMILLAAQPSVNVSMKNPLLDVQSNLVGLVNMLEAARKCSCKKIVFASSGGTIYGDVSESQLPLVETLPFAVLSFYGLTKMTAHTYLDLYKKNFGIDYVALALGNVYGPRQSPAGEFGVVAKFADKILNDVQCTVFGDGTTTRDYTFVSDVAQAFVLAIEHGYGLINIGTGIETSVNEIYSKIAKKLNKDISPIYGQALPGEVKRVSLNSAKANQELGWQPKITLDNGISEVISWLNHEKEFHA